MMRTAVEVMRYLVSACPTHGANGFDVVQRAVGSVHHPLIGLPPVGRVELDAREGPVLVDFPAVRASVVIDVLLDALEGTLLIELRPIDFAVAARGSFDAAFIRTGGDPGVDDAVTVAGRPDLLELPVGIVVL